MGWHEATVPEMKGSTLTPKPAKKNLQILVALLKEASNTMRPLGSGRFSVRLGGSRCRWQVIR